MAKQLKKQQESRHVHNLLVQGRKIVKSQAIETEFWKFYEELYNIQTAETLQSEDMERQRMEEIWEYIKDASLLIKCSKISYT